MKADQQVQEIEIGSAEYRRIVRETREAINADGWTVADNALRITPPGCLIRQRLMRFADDVDLSLATLQRRRFVAAQWPETKRRRDKISFEVHSVLAGHDDRYEIVAVAARKTGLTINQARELAGQSTSSRGGQPAPTLISIRVEIIEIKRRCRNILHVLQNYELADDGSTELLLGDLAEANEVMDQIGAQLTGMSMAEALDEILAGGAN